MDKAKEFASQHLNDFKKRMRITHKEEDDYLTRILSSSVDAVARLVGSKDYCEELIELTFERARYVYHDALDEFRDNYANEIEDLYLSIKQKET